MKKINLKLTIFILLLSIITPFFGNMLAHIVSRKNDDVTPPSVVSSSLSYQNNLGITPYALNELQFLSTNSVTVNELANSDVYSYTTYNSNNENATTVRLEERMLPSGKIVELVFVNEVLEGYLNYDDGYLTDIEIANTSIYYDYNEQGYIDAMYHDKEAYNYIYQDDLLSQINLNNQPFLQVSYDAYKKATEETYPNLSKRYKYSNSHKAEYIYNAEEDSEFLYQLTSLLDYDPYENIVLEPITLNNNTYQLVKSLDYEGKQLQLEYNYSYNDTPFITKATYDETVIDYSYVNDLLVSETYNNAKITYIYSSTKQLVAIMFSTKVEDEYANLLLPVVTDAFSNITQINYNTMLGEGENATIQNNIAMQATYNAFGQKSYYTTLENFDISLGYKSLLQFNQFHLNYHNGSLYSTLNGISLNDASNLNPRQYEPVKNRKTIVQQETILHSLLVENVQKHLYETYKISTVDQAFLWQNNQPKYAIDVYIVPASIEPNNFGLNEYELYNLYAENDQVKQNRLTNIYENFNQNSWVQFNQIEAGLLGTLNLKLQFIYQNKLYLITQVQDGLLKYEAIEDYTKNNYIQNLNLINYDTGKYLQYFKSTIDLNNYFSDFDLTFGLNSVDEFNNHLKEISYVDSTYAELFTEQDYGENTEVIARIIQNTFELNIPNFNPQTEYLDIDENGDYIVLPIPEDAKGEKVINYRNILKGAGLIAFGVIATVSAVVLAIPTCGGSVVVIGVVLKAVAIGAAILGTVAGGLMIAHELQEDGNYIVNKFFDGDQEKLYRFGQLALTISSVANLAGGVLNKFAMCFVAGTQIDTIDDKTPIEQIEEGDYVLSYNESTGKQSYQKVKNTFVRTVEQLIKIEYNNSEIVTTNEHPFFINGSWLEAKNLVVGMPLTPSNNLQEIITNITVLNVEPTLVYNFEVENTHTYYVAGGILVHNACSAKYLKDAMDDIGKDPKFAKALEHVDDVNSKGNLSSKFDTVRKNIWKKYGNSLDELDDNFSRITNLPKVKKGSAPMVKIFDKQGNYIGDMRIDLHHVYGKLNPAEPGTIYKVIPVKWSDHINLHKKYTYQYEVFKFEGKFSEIIKVVFK